MFRPEAPADHMEQSSPRLDVLPPQTVSIRMKDGVRLDADIYRPARGGPYPVLLQRQAYGRRIACTICYAHPAWYASKGYVVVVQDIRGRGTSEGAFSAGENEASDGAETIAWAAALEGSTGDVGMYGFSYQGYNQLLAALEAGPALKALAPAMAPWHARETWAYENGAFRLAGALGWATQIAAETARHRGDAEAYAELLTESRALNVRGAVQTRPAYMEKHRALSHYHRWLVTPADDPYWARISPAAHAEKIAAANLPMLFVGGWYDTHLRSTWEAFHELQRRGNENLHLTIGPWLHFPWERKVGGQDFGPDAALNMDDVHIRFFDRFLKRKTSDKSAKIRLFDMGEKQWRTFGALPQASLRLFLSSSGRAAIDPTDGRLVLQQAASGIDHMVNDPWRPAPSVGCAFGSPPGPVDRSSVDTRGDVITFTTAALDRKITLAGAVSASLLLTADAPSFDVGCVLSRVATNGQVIPLCDGYRSVRDREAGQAVQIPMRATCVTLLPGESLRLSISAASFPAYPVNPGTGADPARSLSVDARVVTLSIHLGGEHASALTVTLVE